MSTVLILYIRTQVDVLIFESDLRKTSTFLTEEKDKLPIQESPKKILSSDQLLIKEQKKLKGWENTAFDLLKDTN